MDVFASPATVDHTRRGALRRLCGSWFLVLFFLAVLVLGFKEPTPAPGTLFHLIPAASSTGNIVTRDASIGTPVAAPANPSNPQKLFPQVRNQSLH